MPNTALWFVVAVEVLTGLLFIGLAIPLARRWVPPNGTYGVRLPATFADERVWYDINALGGRHMIGIGIGYLVVLGAAQIVGRAWRIEFRLLLPIALLVLALIADVVVLVTAANRQLKRLRGPLADPRKPPELWR